MAQRIIHNAGISIGGTDLKAWSITARLTQREVKVVNNAMGDDTISSKKARVEETLILEGKNGMGAGEPHRVLMAIIQTADPTAAIDISAWDEATAADNPDYTGTMRMVNYNGALNAGPDVLAMFSATFVGNGTALVNAVA